MSSLKICWNSLHRFIQNIECSALQQNNKSNTSNPRSNTKNPKQNPWSPTTNSNSKPNPTTWQPKPTISNITTNPNSTNTNKNTSLSYPSYKTDNSTYRKCKEAKKWMNRRWENWIRYWDVSKINVMRSIRKLRGWRYLWASIRALWRMWAGRRRAWWGGLGCWRAGFGKFRNIMLN